MVNKQFVVCFHNITDDVWGDMNLGAYNDAIFACRKMMETWAREGVKALLKGKKYKLYGIWESK